MADEWTKYVDDPRSICKYGAKCYQKNPQHLAKFKHTPHSKRKPDKQQQRPKRAKIQSESPKRPSDDFENSEKKIVDRNSLESESEPKVSPVNPPERSAPTEPPSSSEETHIKKTTNEPARTPTSLEIFTFDDAGVDKAKMIKELFLMEMPKDFFSFWQFICKENETGTNILKAVNLEAIGAFDVLQDKLPPIEDKDQYLVHWRFFYDPPEFQAILKGSGKSEFHFGYFRDSPNETPVFVGSNDSSKDCNITPMSSNIFGALYLHLQAEKKKSPFAAMSHQKIIEKLKMWAQKNNFTLDSYNTRKRLASQAVTRTFHGAGIVVPYNKSSQLGYRPLVENDAGIKKMLAELSSAQSDDKKDKILSELQPVITYANIAMDECDFGTGLELGIDLFCSGLAELDATTLAALTTAYTLLNRHPFIKIIQTHLKYRRKGAELSVLNIK